MRLNVSVRLALVVVCTGAMWGCGDSRSRLLPTSPSSVSSQPSPRSAGTATNTVLRRVDDHRDGYEDGGGSGDPMPDPNTAPPPDPGPMPNPGQLPPPDGVVVPVQLTINIVSTFGVAAFAPNPLQAAMGNTIVWSNTDLILHDIVLDDGTPVGVLAPGQSSAPIALTTPTAGYHCTLHPSMVGQVTTVLPEQPAPVPLPAPGDPSQPPVPAPGYTPPPADPYDYGYDDYSYLR